MPQQFYSMTYHDALFLCDYGGFVATGELLQAGQLQADLYDRFQHVLCVRRDVALFVTVGVETYGSASAASP
jgi:hypothetical protein